MAGGLILVIGFILFSSCLVHNNLNLALVSLTSSLIFWIIYGLLLDVFDLRLFSWVISLVGFLLALSVFFLFGIEEVPHPIGAFIFHTSGIAGALGISFFSFFPLLIIHQLNSEKIIPISNTLINKDDPSSIPDLESDDWECATEDELHSGEFELS